MQNSPNITYVQEIQRKGIHLAMLLMPLIYVHVDQPTALIILGTILAISLAVNIVMYASGPVADFVFRLFGPIMRPHELDNRRFVLNGASWVLISAFMCVLVFPKVITVVAFTDLILADIAAALIGRRYGRTPFLGKSLEGTVAFWITAQAVLLVVGWIIHAPWQFYLVGGIAGILGGFAESLSTRMRIDDNFAIPASIGFSLWALLYLLDDSVRDRILSAFM